MDVINDNVLSEVLLKDITFIHGNKVLRTGKLLLFSVKDFYLHFTITINNTNKHFETPYPFQLLKVSENLFLLDFSLSAFKAEYSFLDSKIKTIGSKKRSRFFNSIVRLHTT
jgi:hypothetical protein